MHPVAAPGAQTPGPVSPRSAPSHGQPGQPGQPEPRSIGPETPGHANFSHQGHCQCRDYQCHDL